MVVCTTCPLPNTGADLYEFFALLALALVVGGIMFWRSRRIDHRRV